MRYFSSGARSALMLVGMCVSLSTFTDMVMLSILLLCGPFPLMAFISILPGSSSVSGMTVDSSSSSSSDIETGWVLFSNIAIMLATSICADSPSDSASNAIHIGSSPPRLYPKYSTSCSPSIAMYIGRLIRPILPSEAVASIFIVKGSSIHSQLALRRTLTGSPFEVPLAVDLRSKLMLWSSAMAL